MLRGLKIHALLRGNMHTRLVHMNKALTRLTSLDHYIHLVLPCGFLGGGNHSIGIQTIIISQREQAKATIHTYRRHAIGTQIGVQCRVI